MQDLQVGVELLTDAVADERPDDAERCFVGMAFDRPPDVGERAARA